MTAFAFTELVPVSGDVISSALGTVSAPNGIYSSNDVGRAVKLGNANNYIDVVANDEIEGFITSVEAFPVNNGFSFGGVMVEGRKVVTVDTGVVSTAIPAYVVAGTQPAIVAPSVGMVANQHNGAASQATVKPGSPAKHFWRVISNATNPTSTTFIAGDKVVIERVG
jgi:hypothetical protein